MNNTNWKYRFRKEKDPRELKERLLDFASAFFKMVSEGGNKQTNKEGLMDSMILIVKEGVRGYYTDSLDRKTLVKKVTSLIDSGINLGPYDPITLRHLRTRENVVEKFRRDMEDFRFDTVIPVMSGGLEPALLINEEEGMIPIRYSRIKYNDTKPYSPLSNDDLEKRIEGKKILIAEDVIASGRAILGVANLVEKFKPSEIYLSTVLLEGHLPKESYKKGLIKSTLWQYK